MVENFYHQYLCAINKLYCCVMHIIENISVDIIEMFAMYIIAIYLNNDECPMEMFCQILRKYCMYDMAPEFTLNFDKFRPQKVNINFQESIILICTFNDIINDIFEKIPILTDNDKFILDTFKFFVFKNAKHMKRFWIALIQMHYYRMVLLCCDYGILCCLKQS